MLNCMALAGRCTGECNASQSETVPTPHLNQWLQRPKAETMRTASCGRPSVCLGQRGLPT